MKKTDAELIAEVEGLLYNGQATLYEAVGRNFGKDLAVSTLLLLPELARRLKAANERIEKADEIICGQLTQACNWGDGNKLDHKFLSAYEDAQYYLIETGRITQDDCKNK